jgi:hypothetical protein
MSKVIKGQLISVWENGLISTYAELDIESGELINVRLVNTKNLSNLERKYFMDKDGNQYSICVGCYDFILKSVMNPGIGHDLNEETVCPNPDCVNN